MKIKYNILYRSGQKDEIIQEGTQEKIQEINDAVFQAFEHDLCGVITFGDEETKGYFIRVSDVSRMSIKILEQ